MAYTRKFRTIIPVEPGADVELLRWLTRESFERKAEGECLRIVEYSEAVVPADEIPPKVAEHLDRPIAEYEWREFAGVGRA